MSYEEDTQQVEQFLQQLDKFHPTIPESVAEYHLRKSGFHTTDPRAVKTVSLAAQKFMADIAHDALQYCKMRTSVAKKGGGKDVRLVLTTEDLSNALKNYGVTVMKTDVLGPAGPPQPPASAARGDQAAASGGNAAGGVAAAEGGA